MTGILNALIAGVSGAIKDTYFNLVSLLLPGNGTNGATNNSFVDSSTANSGTGWPITRNGDVTQGTFSPFSQTGWGAYFDGSNDTVSLSGTPITTTTWTIEAWVYLTGGIVERNLYSQATGGNANRTQLFFYAASGTDPYINIFSASGNQGAASTSRVTSNQWNHVAIQCNGTNVTFYINGQQSGSSSFTASWQSTAGVIGAYIGGGYLNGYVSNFRITNTNVYSGNFTPSTTPLTNISGTQILTLQNNRFIDNAATPNTLTPNNGVAITPFSPFAPTSSYSAAAVGGSGYFDGSGDYLSVADNAAFTMGTGDFTVEYWVYWNGTGSTFRAYGQVDSGGSSASISIRGGTDASNKVINGAFSGTTDYLCTSTASLVANTWNHIAFVRDGTTLRQYINGGQDGTASISTASVNDSSSQFAIGRAGEFNGNYFGGYISSFRLLKGTCLYPSGTAFTPPTAPLTNITNTSLLLNFTNAGVVDATAKNVLETEGNAQISNGAAKFGTTSIYLNGDGNYLTSRGSPVFSLNGDFTMEAWVYPINAGRSADAEKYGTIVSCAAVGVSNPEFSWFIRIVGGVVTEYFLNLNFTTVLQVTGLSVSLNAWHYFAVTRSGTGTGNLKLYIDGTLVGTSSGAVTQSATFTSAQTLMVGRNAGSTAYQNWLSGYFQGVRITPGYVRTVTTVPTAPFPLQ
jgi:hypothetical protein